MTGAQHTALCLTHALSAGAGTSDVDVRPLLRGFDLHAFDQFMDAEDYETRLKAAMAQRTLRSAAKAAAGENAART